MELTQKKIVSEWPFQDKKKTVIQSNKKTLLIKQTNLFYNRATYSGV
jgi:hypothetical protein